MNTILYWKIFSFGGIQEARFYWRCFSCNRKHPFANVPLTSFPSTDWSSISDQFLDCKSCGRPNFLDLEQLRQANFPASITEAFHHSR